MNRALECFHRALDICPTRDTILTSLASVYQDIKQYSKAELYIKKACMISPTNRYYLGELYLEMGEYENAIPEFESCVSESRNNLLPLFHIGVCYEKLQRLQEANSIYESLYKKDPRNKRLIHGLKRMVL